MGATLPEIGRADRFEKPSIIQEEPASFLIRVAATAQFDCDERKDSASVNAMVLKIVI